MDSAFLLYSSRCSPLHSPVAAVVDDDIDVVTARAAGIAAVILVAARAGAIRTNASVCAAAARAAVGTSSTV